MQPMLLVDLGDGKLGIRITARWSWGPVEGFLFDFSWNRSDRNRGRGTLWRLQVKIPCAKAGSVNVGAVVASQ